MVQTNPKTNTPKKYRKVNVPESMATKIDKIVEENNDLGFSGVDDFVRDAIRDSIIRYYKLKNK